MRIGDDQATGDTFRTLTRTSRATEFHSIAPTGTHERQQSASELNAIRATRGGAAAAMPPATRRPEDDAGDPRRIAEPETKRGGAADGSGRMRKRSAAAAAGGDACGGGGAYLLCSKAMTGLMTWAFIGWCGCVGGRRRIDLD